MVAVTGASGYIGAWLVKLLLEKGYTVRATVRNPNDTQKTAHLRSLPNAETNLSFHKAELLDEGAFGEVFEGVDGVFHMASPFPMAAPEDPEADLIAPAVKGAESAIKAAAGTKKPIKRVVLTSSTAAVRIKQIAPGKAFEEDDWSDEERMRNFKIWYPLSKTLAEKRAWELAKELNVDLVTVNPSMVTGPIIQPSLNTSSNELLKYLDGSVKAYPNSCMVWVDVRDVALAHLIAYEHPDAAGRLFAAPHEISYKELTDFLAKEYPNAPVPRVCADPEGEKNNPPPRNPCSVVKLEKLGLQFRPVWQSFHETLESLKEKGLYTPA
ncbi:cinnamoyl CoA reductase [Klebsormidium nitens]|uniref:Cinnamoyl CoA reductase n=1 Tax=Klebsormidium nitens TaxID=105231 RepID=A0A1Y1HQ77_KLENI|nr:cinnamoyl CoA reductase [Klebsormidium nitens]|eukprot:GAQ80785.1 cinnamoyl CoA reductase [Klebsormidium nitens]